MTLTKTERIILANQYQILALLDKKNATDYDGIREALEDNYPLAYEGFFDRFSDGLTLDECGFVNEVLAMFDALQRTKVAGTQFPGFDGNNETMFMAYARYIRKREGRFDYLEVGSADLNSHFPSVDGYRRMLAAWERHGKSYELTADQAKEILESRRLR
jgi:hypothetical protein